MPRIWDVNRDGNTDSSVAGIGIDTYSETDDNGNGDTDSSGDDTTGDAGAGTTRPVTTVASTQWTGWTTPAVR